MREALDTADDPNEALSQFVGCIPDHQIDALPRALKARR